MSTLPRNASTYKSILPLKARANGLWRGPLPTELMNLSFMERKIIRLGHICCSIFQVRLGDKQYHAIQRAGGLQPESHCGNVMAYPQFSNKVPQFLGVLPEKLGIGKAAKYIKKHYIWIKRAIKEHVRSKKELLSQDKDKFKFIPLY